MNEQEWIRTEEEWTTWADPQLMLAFMRGKVSDRRLTLFVLDCAYRNWASLDEAGRRLYQLLDLYTETRIGLDELNAAYDEATQGNIEEAPDRYELAFWDSDAYQINSKNRPAERAAQLATIRDIFGNPFRPVTFDPAWRTTDVMLLARGIYEEKAFDRMPILADALQDAGCDSDALLAHVRDTSAPHVRGCWALDLVLGKE